MKSGIIKKYICICVKRQLKRMKVVNFFPMTAKIKILLKNFSINSQVTRQNLISQNTGLKNIFTTEFLWNKDRYNGTKLCWRECVSTKLLLDNFYCSSLKRSLGTFSWLNLFYLDQFAYNKLIIYNQGYAFMVSHPYVSLDENIDSQKLLNCLFSPCSSSWGIQSSNWAGEHIFN